MSERGNDILFVIRTNLGPLAVVRRRQLFDKVLENSILGNWHNAFKKSRQRTPKRIKISIIEMPFSIQQTAKSIKLYAPILLNVPPVSYLVRSKSNADDSR